MGEFKLELQSQNALIGSKLAFFVLCDLEILWMTLKNNKAPLPCYLKLCVSFNSHRSIQTAVTVRKCPIRVKINDFLSCVTLKVDGWPWKTLGRLLYATSSFVHHFIPICEFKLELQSGKAQFGSHSAIFFVPCDIEIWWMTLITGGNRTMVAAATIVRFPSVLIFCMDITFVIGKYSRKFDDDTMTGTWWKGVTKGQTDGRTGRSVLRAAWSQLKKRNTFCERSYFCTTQQRGAGKFPTSFTWGTVHFLYSHYLCSWPCWNCKT